MEKLYTIVQHVIERVEFLLHTLFGWVCALGIVLLNYIAGHEFAVCLVVALTLMDAVWGIAVSIAVAEYMAWPKVKKVFEELIG